MSSRKFVLVAFSALMSTPLWAQGTPVRAASQPRGSRVSPLDTMRAMLQWRNPTIDEVVAWSAEVAKRLDELKAVTEKAQRESRSADDRRQVELKIETIRTVGEVQQAQRILADVCNLIRPHQSESEGVLGFQIEIGGGTAFQQNGPAIKEERFVRTPAISYVEPNTPAAQADIREGDLWVAIAGRELMHTYVRELNDVLKPGNKVDLKLRRDGKDMNVEVIAKKRRDYPEEACSAERLQIHTFGQSLPKIQFGGPPPGSAQSFFTMKITRTAFAGAAFADLTDAKRERLKVPAGEKGAVVENINPGSAADLAGLRELDVVLRANNEVIESAMDLLKVVQQGGPVALYVWDGVTQRTVRLPAGR